MGARGNRGLIAGLASLAGSTGRIRVANEDRLHLAMKLRLAELEAKRRQQELDATEHDTKLSDLLESDRAAAIMAIPGLSEEQKYALSRGLRAGLPFGQLSTMLGQANQPAVEDDALLRRARRLHEELGIPMEESLERAGLGLPRQAQGSIPLSQKVAEYQAEVETGKSKRLSGLNLLEMTPERQAKAEAESKAELAAVSGIDVPGRLPEPPKSAGLDKTTVAKKQITDMLDAVLDREVEDEAQKDAIAEWLKAGNSPLFNVLRGYAELPTEGNLSSLQATLYDIAKSKSGLEALGVPMRRGFMRSPTVAIP